MTWKCSGRSVSWISWSGLAGCATDDRNPSRTFLIVNFFILLSYCPSMSVSRYKSAVTSQRHGASPLATSSVPSVRRTHVTPRTCYTRASNAIPIFNGYSPSMGAGTCDTTIPDNLASHNVTSMFRIERNLRAKLTGACGITPAQRTRMGDVPHDSTPDPTR